MTRRTRIQSTPLATTTLDSTLRQLRTTAGAIYAKSVASPTRTTPADASLPRTSAAVRGKTTSMTRKADGSRRKDGTRSTRAIGKSSRPISTPRRRQELTPTASASTTYYPTKRPARATSRTRTEMALRLHSQLQPGS